ncbi:MAG: tRNA1(Val) (adenine(37)-N6)-methyltransferase [Bacilli bacterium]|nr:tRNA1(Val) (adenine(37)-N6)-methyltransferase [Bacilli bacterium]MDD4282692.1 tRNA1(Val) (adenine(37)-N6)-methyltransferase [Bacilli bacterium]
MEVVNYLLGYNNLKIYQNSNMFNFSLDSVLLPNFVTINSKIKQVLDIGCGNAPISLILTTKTKAHITGVEIQEKVYKLAQKSVEINNLNHQITLINDDINNLVDKWESDFFDIIVCNPPFFKVNNKSRLNESDYKTIARHEITLNVEKLMEISRKLLKNNGVVAIVHRPERMIEIIQVMRKNNIEPKKIQLVYPKIGETANIILIEGRKNGNEGLTILPPIITHNKNGKYTEIIKNFFE